MLTIREIQDCVKEMLDKAYLSKDSKGRYIPAPLPEEATSMLIEQAGFMRQQDADAIRKAASQGKIIVSFRTAGADTIQRIKEGHPCKGHEIEDKSIKNSKGQWTYLLSADVERGIDGDAVLETLKGFVGSPNIPYIPGSGSVIDDFHPTLAPKRFFNADGTVARRIFHLKEVYVLPGDAQVKGQEASACSYAKLPYKGLSPTDLKMAYTGDYDMHDLICNGRRALATTPVEHTAIDLLNNAILKADSKRDQSVKKSLGKTGRTFSSPYALIRHGSQTSYLDYLTTAQGDKEMKKEIKRIEKELGFDERPFLPFEKTIIKIDDNILVFDTTGKAYILQGVKQIYNFYVQKNLLDQIPFYNFFNALREVDFGPETDANRAAINSCVAYMLSILGVDRGLIRNHPWQQR